VPGTDRKCEFEFKGKKRSFLIYAPQKFNPCAPTPLIVDAHGAGETAEEHAGLKPFRIWPDGLGSGWRLVADREGFVVISLQALDDFRTNADLDYVFEVERMATQVANVDPARVYMTGISNGGFFTVGAGCRDQGVFRGVAPVAGGTRTQSCPMSRPTPYVGFHAKTDTTIPYSNGLDGAKLWAQSNHCKSGPTPSLAFGGPDTDKREVCLKSGPGFTPPWNLTACSTTAPVSTCETWEQCDEGAKVTFCTVNAEKQLVGGHILYINDTQLSLAAVAWEAFKELAK
jgi:predicted esterase